MTIFNAHGGLPLWQPRPCTPTKPLLLNLWIGKSQDDGTQHSEGSYAHARCACSYADIVIGE